MGLKSHEISPATITPYTPGAREVKVKAFQVARTDTSTVVKAQLPAAATIIDVKFYTNTASDATTSASISLGLSGGTTTAIVNAQDVKTAAGLIRPTTAAGATGLYVLEAIPLTVGQNTITATYASSGAQTTGGPWTVVIEYIE